MEADETKRRQYLETLKETDRKSLVYIDESGIDMNLQKERGWGKKGEKLIAKKSGKYYQRTNIISGYVNKEAIAPFIFNGTCNTKIFEDWVEKFLIKELKKDQIVVMDNATFHKSKRTKELIESVGCGVVFLPPYSPDLNPIEKFWANMKGWLKQKMQYFKNLFDALYCFFNSPNLI